MNDTLDPGAGRNVLLRLQGIHKRFPGVHALRGVDLDVHPGEVHAVVGENGAGKSTLMHILAGVYRPDSGRIDFDGEGDTVFANERIARDRGVALVYQERSLFGPLTVAENIFAGRQPVNRWGRIDQAHLRSESISLLRLVGLDVDPGTPMERLSSARQQLVEVAKALSLKAKLIIFDEPTAALANVEVDALFRVIRQLREQQVGVIYISHRLEEVFEIADRATVLKDGSGQGTYHVSDLTPRALVSKMVGRDLDLSRSSRDHQRQAGDVVLEVTGLNDDPDRTEMRPRLCDISFEVRGGEIVALSGLVGAGRTEVALALFGSRPGVSGRVRVNGSFMRLRSPRDAIAAGIGYLPEDRKESGLFLEMSISDNVAASASRRFGSWHYRADRQDQVAEELCRNLRVVHRRTDEPVKNLSGGNQQKVVLARWLLANPRVLIVDEPTRGVDVGAKAEIHQLLFEQARQGAAVIVISSDLPEVLALADRILVMREGRIAGEMTRENATESEVMELASMG